MNIFDNKRKFRKMAYSKIVSVCLIVVCAMLVNGLFNIYGKARESLDRKNFSAQSLLKLNNREEKLRREIERLDTRVGLEEELRSRYSFSKEGERVIVIIDENNTSEMASTSDEKTLTDRATSWIKRVTLIE